MKWYQKILLSFIISVLFYNLVNTQQILYVSSAGTGTSCTLSSPCSLSQVFGLTSDSDIVTLLSGTYEITSSITITSNNLLINSYTSPQTTILTSPSNITIFNVLSPNITIESLSFINCIGRIGIFGNGVINNCYFQEISSNFNALYFSGNGTISNSIFDSILSVQTVSTNSQSTGGIVYFYSNGILNNSTFINIRVKSHYRTQGGLIYFQIGSITNSLFENCTAVSDASISGGIVWSTSKATIEGTTFKNCTNFGLGTVAGVVALSLGSITNSHFEDCHSFANTSGYTQSTGGALYIIQYADVENSTFINCTANSVFDNSFYDIGNLGGAIKCGTSTTTISNSFFSNCFVHGNGSAIHSIGSLNITNCLFENNVAVGYGILYASVGMFIQNTGFYNNTAASIIFLDGKSSISDSYFINNIGYSFNESFIAIVTSYYYLPISNTLFSNNRLLLATNCMGILYLLEGGSVDNSTFKNNQAYQCYTTYSAAILQRGTPFTLSRSVFDNNTIDTEFNSLGYLTVINALALFNLTNLTFQNTISPHFCIFFPLLINDDLFLIDNSQFLDNNMSVSLILIVTFNPITMIINNSVLQSNKFQNAVNFITLATLSPDSAPSNILIKNSSFINNINGTINCEGEFLLSNSNIQNNEAVESLFQLYGRSTIINSNFSENVISVEGYSTDINGGVLYCGANGECNIIQSNFNKNLLSGGNNCQGTVIYSNNYLNISDTTFNENINNCLNSYGGAISISKSISNTTQLIEISNTSFLSNSLDSQTGYGGAIYSEIAFNIENLSFINNSITGESLKSAYGAAVYFQDNSNDNNINQQEISSQSPILFSQTNFISNFIETSTEVSNSEYSGAAISFSTTKNILISNCTFEENFISMKVSFLNSNTILSVGLSGVAISSLFSNDSSSNLDPSMTIINSSFIENSIAAEGCSKYTIIGGLINSGSFNLMINDSNFRDNQMTWGTNSPFIIGMLLYSNNSISMDQSQFRNNTGIKLNNICEESVANIVQGGNVYCNKVLSSNSNYINNQINGDIIEGGIIWMRSGSFNNSLFQSNICSTQSISFSSAGGCIWISSTSNINSSTLENTLFLNNTADYGAGYCIGEFGSYPMIHNVSMQNNNATESGSVYIMNNLLNEWLNCSDLTGSTANNTSEYGIDCGSTASELSFYSSIPIFIYPSQIFQVELYLNDWFESLIDNSLYRVNLEETTYLSVGVENQYSVSSVNGIFSYQYLTFYSPVGSNNSLVFTAQPNNNNINNNKNNNNNNNNATHSLLNNRIFTQNIILQTISCPPSAYYRLNTTGVAECISCGSNQYSFDGLSCVDCPQLSSSEGQSFISDCISASSPIVQNNNTIFEMVINEGWWPNSFVNPSYLIACPYSNSCKNITCFITLNLLYSPSNNSGNNNNNSSIDNGYGWIINCESCNSTSPYNNYYYDENNNNDNEGGESSCYCNEGYQEYLCSECVCNTIKECYYQSNYQCVQCEIFTTKSLIGLILFVIVLVIIIIIVIFVPKTTLFFIISGVIFLSILSLAGILTWYYSTLMFAILLCYFIADRKFPEGLLKSLFFYLQVITSIVTLNSWPVPLYGVIQTFEITNLNLSIFTCFWPSVLSHPLNLFILVILIIPILSLFIILAVIFESYISTISIIQRCRHQSYKSEFIKSVENDDDLHSSVKFDNSKEEFKQQIIKKISVILIRLANIGYFPLTLIILSVLSCENGYMKEYQWIECNSSSDYIYFVILSSIVILLYVIGYPVCLCIILILYRLSYRSFTIIFDNYKVKADYFEILFIFKKLSIIILLTLFTGFIQKILLSSVLLIGIILQYFIAPFKSRALNKLQLLVEIVILFSSIFSSLNSFYNLSDATFLFWSWTMSIINAIILLLYLILLVRSHWIFTKITSKLRSKNYTII